MRKFLPVVATAVIVLAGLTGCASMGRRHGPVESFVIPAAANPGLPGDLVGALNLAGEPKEVRLVVAPGTDVHALVARFSLNTEAAITVISSGSRLVQQNGVTPNDFSSPLMYSIEVPGQKEPWRYRVTVREMETNPRLAQLVLPAGSRFLQRLDPAVHEYRAKVPYASTLVRVEARAQSRFAKSVSVDGKEIPGPVGRADVDFTSFREKPVTIDILAEDGVTRDRYTITPARGAPGLDRKGGVLPSSLTMSGAFSLACGQNDVFAPIPLGGAAARGLRAGLSLAKAGDMSLSRRAELPWRNRFLKFIGAVPRSTYSLHQCHSKNVLVVDGQEPEALEGLEADGMVSARPDALLTVTVADCLPVFLLDAARGAYGIVHSGWKGTGIVREALRLMNSAFGTEPGDVSAVLGPCIGPCCYRVQQARYERFLEDFGSCAVVRVGEPGDYRLDLRAANVQLLSRAGVLHISVCSDCTGCSPALGSFRRQGAESFTLMLAFIGHLPEAAA